MMHWPLASALSNSIVNSYIITTQHHQTGMSYIDHMYFSRPQSFVPHFLSLFSLKDIYTVTLYSDRSFQYSLIGRIYIYIYIIPEYRK